MWDLSLIIPCYKAAPILERSLSPLQVYLKSRGLRAQILLVDDGSDDAGATAKIAAQNGCVYLANPINQGKGAAVKRGMLAAEGAVCLFTDADIPFGFSSIEQFYQTLRHGDCDMVIGDRSLKDSAYSSRLSYQRAIASYVFRMVVGRKITEQFPDTQCGLKGFSRLAAQSLFPHVETSGFAFDVEVLYLAKAAELIVRRLPVQLQNQGDSSVRLFTHAPQMLRELVHIRSRKMPTINRPIQKRSAMG